MAKPKSSASRTPKKQRAQGQTYYAANADKKAEYDRKYREANKEEIAEKARNR